MSPDCPSTTHHGTGTAYSHAGCRCPEARQARATAEARRQLALLRGQPLTIPAHGVRRRIRALYWMGWTGVELGRRLGIPHYRVHILGTTKQKRVLRATHEKVAALYEEISHLPGPSPYTAGQARARRYAPPLAWDEDTIDDPTARPAGASKRDHDRIHPDRVAVLRIWQREPPKPLHAVDRREFIRQAVDRGLTQAEIADYLGVRTVNVQVVKRQAATVLLQDEPVPE